MIGNFVQETANAPGSAATVTLAGASPGRRGIIAAFGGGVTVYLGMEDGTQWQLVEALTVAGPPQQITITNVLSNSAGTTARLNFTGSVRIYSVIPAERNVYARSDGSVPLSGQLTVDGDGVFRSGSLRVRSNATNRHVWFEDLAGAEGGVLWHDFATGTMRLRAGGGFPIVVEAAGHLTATVGDITAQAGSLRAQISGAPTTGQVLLGNGAARLYYNGTLFDLNAALSAPVFRGGPGDAGTLRTHGTANSVNFRWDGSGLLYRIDEVLEQRIAVRPQSVTGVGEWRQISSNSNGDLVLPSGGTWAYSCAQGASVAAGGTQLSSGQLYPPSQSISSTLCWRIA